MKVFHPFCNHPIWKFFKDYEEILEVVFLGLVRLPQSGSFFKGVPGTVSG